MTRRRVLLLGSVAVAAALVVAGARMVRPRSAITDEAAKRVREGMTLAEVEAVLGGPARDETGGHAVVNYLAQTHTFGLDHREWIGPETAVFVVLRDNRVVAARVGQAEYPQVAPLERIRRWLGL